MNKEFFEALLKCPSPSGDEVKIQKKWKSYVSEFAHQVETDTAGNVIAILNPDKDFKIMLAGHVDEIAFMVTYIDDQGFVYVTKAGGISPKLALGQRVRILGKEQTISGVVGVPAEHHGGSKGEVKIDSLYIDFGAKDKAEAEKHITVGDYIIYDLDYNYMLNDLVAGRGLDNRTGSFIVSEVIKRLSKEVLNVGVYGVSTVNEETNMGGAYFAASRIKPTCGIACDVTFATDYVGCDKKKLGEVKLNGGPVFSKGAQVNPMVNEKLILAAEKLEIKYQREVTPSSTGTDADKIRFTNDGVPVALISLPLRYMHSSSEVISMRDMEQVIQVLVEMIKNLDGQDHFKPVED